MTTPPSDTKGPAAGSSAGRGFRYQDYVGALFVSRMYAGHSDVDTIIPEGSDDYELCAKEGVILVDAKSTRPGARGRSESANATSLRALWARTLRPGTKPLEYWLITERPRGDGTGEAKTSATALFDAPVPVSASVSYCVVEPDPFRAAVELLTSERGITPLAAELVVIAFARAVGELASANGPLALEKRQGITPSDAEHISSRVLTAVGVDHLEALLRSGFVNPVDLTTPLDDPGFYLGVDVQPGHFAAGLALDRPEEAGRIVEALRRSGAAVVRGPSGAGKSGLMWNAVLASRAERRWFRVNVRVVPSADALTAFFAAYAGVAIGFVIDDVGRGGIEAWNALREPAKQHGQSVLLGSVRSEDAVLLPARHAIAEVEAEADGSLARTLWSRLRERQQTQWPGWSEPWGASKGLLLEYGHILTAGARLSGVILDQVRTRLAQGRDDELAILSASALVAAQGGSASIETLRRHLNFGAGDMARALDRLIAEHLIRVDPKRETLSELHSLRAAAIATALAEVGYATLRSL